MSSSSFQGDSSSTESDVDDGEADNRHGASPPKPNRSLRTSSTSTNNRQPETYSKPLKLSPLVRKAYLDVLYSTGQDSPPGIDATSLLPASQIGASYWTSAEKELLFQCLPLVGRENLAALSRAVATKSEAEVHVYLRLLRQGVMELQTTNAYSNILKDDGDSLAAWEISRSCEAALEEVADAVKLESSIDDATAAKAKYGELWLIDGDVAESLDDVYERYSEVQDTLLDPDKPHLNKSVAAESNKQQLHIEYTNTKTSSHRDESPQPKSLIRDTDLFPSAQLLRPTMFLRLSDALFMNGPPGSGLNWVDSGLAEHSSRGPSLYREAFEDFYNLVIVLTRRLTQTALYQAMTRIRAMDGRKDRTPEKVVKADDVRIACDMLKLQSQCPASFWASAVRHSKVEVYSDSKKYFQGRPRTKNGVKLTYNEVDTELGLRISDAQRSEDSDIAGDVQKTESTPDAWEADELHLSDDESDAANEHEYLESLDRKADLRDEQYLWKHVFGQTPPAMLEDDKSKVDLTRSTTCTTTRQQSMCDTWQEHSTFVSEWQSFAKPLAPELFAVMHSTGCDRRKRRKLHHDAELVVSTRDAGSAQQDGVSDSDEDSGSSQHSLGSSSDTNSEENVAHSE